MLLAQSTSPFNLIVRMTVFFAGEHRRFLRGFMQNKIYRSASLQKIDYQQGRP
jgi:hypothetical protein